MTARTHLLAPLLPPQALLLLWLPWMLPLLAPLLLCLLLQLLQLLVNLLSLTLFRLGLAPGLGRQDAINSWQSRRLEHLRANAYVLHAHVHALAQHTRSHMSKGVHTGMHAHTNTLSLSIYLSSSHTRKHAHTCSHT